MTDDLSTTRSVPDGNAPDGNAPVRYRTCPRGVAGRAAHGAVRALDRFGAAAGLGHARVSAELSRRGLWGMLPRRPAGLPGGEKLVALSFDLDYQADTGALDGLVRLLGRAGAEATLFSIGQLVAQDPAPYRRAAQAGHEIANHTWSHPDNPVLNPEREFWDLTAEEMRAEVEKAQRVFQDELGVQATGFRTPHFKDAPRMMSVLEDSEHLTYLSTTLASRGPLPVPYVPMRAARGGPERLHFSSLDARENSDLLMIPLTPCPVHRWTPFDTYHAIRRPANPEKGAGLHDLGTWEALWETMLRKAAPSGFASVYFDPMDVMRDDETAAAFERMLRRATRGGWQLATLREVARAWRPFVPSQPEGGGSSGAGGGGQAERPGPAARRGGYNGRVASPASTPGPSA